ncbi:cell division protein ZipA [Luteitalea sp. TBR-22]|uniref:AAA family ATPase n=1 Tax=Luteitalea sp. TBR-22 TaxID=2802971 RepID=UPI001AF956B3|nr:ATP-binding protein [Luteitalea sp. TBR-22]BCS31209.1 cell division protein ZipA [Luteitalea sp. TBR-22]
MTDQARLIFLCGKMAAGKSTLARELAAREGAVLLVQDEWLGHLFPGEIRSVADYLRCSARLRAALGPHVCDLLARGSTVVLDFPGNTVEQRAWFRELFERAGVAHELHLIVASDDLCKRQLRHRSRDLPPGTPWTTDEEFDAITAYFQPPSEDERFTVVRHERG